jgi:hypothetical protein
MSGDGASADDERVPCDGEPEGVDAVSAERQRAEEAVKELRGGRG